MDEQGLADYAEIAREIGRKQTDEELQRLSATLRTAPESMNVHITYVGSEPVAGGRLYFPAGGGFAELAGGRTKTTHRRRGLFTAVVRSRLAEAYARGRTLVFTDALPHLGADPRQAPVPRDRLHPAVHLPAGPLTDGTAAHPVV